MHTTKIWAPFVFFNFFNRRFFRRETAAACGDNDNLGFQNFSGIGGQAPTGFGFCQLLRHLAEVERDWRNWILPADPAPKLYGAGDADFDGAVAEQPLVESAFADLAREQAATDAVLAGYPDLGARVVEGGIAVRELWIHRIEEYARHCGHADLLRECIDGRVGQ